MKIVSKGLTVVCMIFFAIPMISLTAIADAAEVRLEAPVI